MRLSDLYRPEEEQGLLARILFPRYLRMLQAVEDLVASLFQRTPQQFRVADPAARQQLALAADQVVRIDQSTRAQLQEVLREGQKRGYSDYQIAHGVPADGYGGIEGLYLETWRGRAETIARTEMATAQNQATLDRYAATGVVSKVQIVEHEDTDEACATRNGTVVPLASRPGLLHPNCRMSLLPVVDEGA